MVFPLLLAGAAMGLAGGAISSAATKEANRENLAQVEKTNEANRPVNQVKEWEQAGINPLWGLSSGSYVPHQAGHVIANTAMGDAISGIGRDMFSTGLSHMSQMRLEKTRMKHENQMLTKQLSSLERNSVPSNMSTHGSSILGGSDEGSSLSTGYSVSSGPSGLGYTLEPERALNSYRVAGTTVHPDLRFSDAEVIEQRHGDLAGAVYGVVTIGADTVPFAHSKLRDHYEHNPDSALSTWYHSYQYERGRTVDGLTRPQARPADLLDYNTRGRRFGLWGRPDPIQAPPVISDSYYVYD